MDDFQRQFGHQFVRPIPVFADALLAMLEASLVIAVIVTILLQMLKEFGRIRWLYNSATLNAWLFRSHRTTLTKWAEFFVRLEEITGRRNGRTISIYYKAPEWLKAALAGAKAEVNSAGLIKGRPELLLNLRKNLPPNLLLGQVQNIARIVSTQPDKYPGDFAVLAANAVQEDVALVYIIGKMGREAPQQLALLLTAGDGAAEAPREASVRAAQDNVAAVTESRLEQLQLDLTFGWRKWLRLAALFLGIVLTLAFGHELGENFHASHTWVVAMIGVVGGFLATVLYDLCMLLNPRRDERT